MTKEEKKKNKKTIIIMSLFFVVVVYLVLPFFLLPVMLSNHQSKEQDRLEFILSDFFNFTYTRFLNSLSESNPYRVTFENYSHDMCLKYKGACNDAP